MSNPLSRLATRVAYGASQLPRVAWYVGHSLAVRRLSEAARRLMEPRDAVSWLAPRFHWQAKQNTALLFNCRESHTAGISDN